MPDAALLFAAGFGTRMAPLTETMPKPLIPVAGRPLIEHALSFCEARGVSRIVVNTHYKADAMARYFAGRDVTLSREEPDILETGGGLRHALPLLNPGPLFTLNTDAVWDGPNPLDGLVEAWDPAKMDALLMCVPHERTRGHRGAGDFSRDAAGRLHRTGELVYTGVQIINPRGIEEIGEAAFSLNVLWNQFAAKGRLHGAIYPGQWCDVGTPAGISEAENMVTYVRP